MQRWPRVGAGAEMGTGRPRNAAAFERPNGGGDKLGQDQLFGLIPINK